MGWIFGYKGANANISEKVLKGIHAESLAVFNNDKLYLLVGGIPETCQFNSSAQNETGWVFCGIGIKREKRNFPDLNELNNEFKKDNFFENYDGHFVALKWSDDSLEISTDKLGLRNIYVAAYKEGYIFSTRIDWIAKLIDCEIDFHEFGAHWLLFNQISKKSVLTNIERFAAGAKIKITNGTVTRSKEEWLPDFNNKINYKSFARDLEQSIVFPLLNGNKLSLSLSGGLDSRLLLSFLLKNGHGNWDAHTFGSPNHPDYIMAKSICSDFNIEHKLLYNEDTGCDLELVKDYVSQNLVNNCASACLQFRYYEHLHKPNLVVVDGGFGEIWRREFFYKLFFKGKDAFSNNNLQGIISNLTLYRADIFSEDVNEIMNKGCYDQLGEYIEEYPSYNEIGIENWLDLLALKCRLVNYIGHEQSRIDSYAFCYMPFVQLSLLDNLFSLPVDLKRNANLFKKILKDNNKLLPKYPLAKGAGLFPYNLSSLQSRLWMLMLKKLNKLYTNSDSLNFLQKHSEFIKDTISSREVRDSGIYNYNNILKYSECLTGKDLSHTNELDWWLAFELFNKNISPTFQNKSS